MDISNNLPTKIPIFPLREAYDRLRLQLHELTDVTHPPIGSVSFERVDAASSSRPSGSGSAPPAKTPKPTFEMCERPSAAEPEQDTGLEQEPAQDSAALSKGGTSPTPDGSNLNNQQALVLKMTVLFLRCLENTTFCHRTNRLSQRLHRR